MRKVSAPAAAMHSETLLTTSNHFDAIRTEIDIWIARAVRLFHFKH
jgi:hypothetical protein